MPITPTNYDGLVSAVKALAEDDSTEFITYIPAAIHLAEERLIKELDTQGLYSVASVTASAGTELLAKPSGYRFGHDLFYKVSGGLTNLPEKKTNEYIKDYWPARSSSSAYPNGQPKYYGDYNKDNWVLAPLPASAYEFTVIYTKQIPHLDSTTSTNYFTDFCSDALLYATMSNMAEFMKDYATQAIWEGKYVNAAVALNNEGKRARIDDSTNANNPKIGQNTLKRET